MNPTNKRLISLSDFQTVNGTAVHATSDTEQHIFHTRAALVDTIASVQGSDRWVISVPKCMIYLLIFTAFWTVLHINRFIIQLTFYHICLILFQGSIMKSEVWSCPFFRTLRTFFLLVKLTTMASSTTLWLRISNNFHLACPSLQTYLRGNKARSKMFNVQI